MIKIVWSDVTIECDTVDEAIAFLDRAHQDNGWIEWGGGKCPVDGETFVEVKFRSGGTERYHARVYYWKHDGNGADIVAYRVVK